MNDLAHDARVIREARSLAAGGHQVTVMTTTSDPSQRTGEHEPTQFLRSDPDRRTASLAAVVRRPGPSVAARPPRCLGAPVDPRRRARLVQAVAYAALTLVLLPWIAVLGAWTFVARVILRRPWHPGVLDYLLRWRSFHLGWAAAAVDHAPIADVHHANDIDTLPAALAAARRDGGQVVYDSHEIYLESSIHARQPRWLRWVIDGGSATWRGMRPR